MSTSLLRISRTLWHFVSYQAALPFQHLLHCLLVFLALSALTTQKHSSLSDNLLYCGFMFLPNGSTFPFLTISSASPPVWKALDNCHSPQIKSCKWQDTPCNQRSLQFIQHVPHKLVIHTQRVRSPEQFWPVVVVASKCIVSTADCNISLLLPSPNDLSHNVPPLPWARSCWDLRERPTLGHVKSISITTLP